jgi:ferredoxin
MNPPPDSPSSPPDAVFRVHMVLEDLAFDAPAGQTLVQSAEAAGLELLTSCRNGTCRTCLRQTRSGSVSYRIEWPGLSPDEKREGCILPCVAYPASDLVID